MGIYTAISPRRGNRRDAYRKFYRGRNRHDFATINGEGYQVLLFGFPRMFELTTLLEAIRLLRFCGALGNRLTALNL